VQLDPGSYEVGHVLLCWREKSPLTEIELMTSVRFPVLERVIALRSLDCPTVTLPKLMLLGLSEMPGAIASPLIVEGEEVPFTLSVTVSDAW
jgi:hypothetical protein